LVLLKALVKFSVSQPWLIVCLAVLFALTSAFTLAGAKLDVFPEFVPAQATLQAEAPGLSAEQVDRLVTRPIEDAARGANGVVSVRSQSIPGLSAVNVEFSEGSNVYIARQALTETLGDVAARLPPSVQAPKMSPLTSSTMDLLKLGFTSTKLSPMALRDYVAFSVRPRLLAVPGVARATLFGGEERRIIVQLQPQILAELGVNSDAVATSVRAALAAHAGGFVEAGGRRFEIEPIVPPVDAQSLAALQLSLPTGARITIGEVARVYDGPSPAFGDTIIMGKPGVLMPLASQYGANTLATTHRVEAVLAQMAPELEAKGVVLHGRLHRPANFIETALEGIATDLLIGSLLIVLVLYGFMRSTKIALIAFVTIPLSLAAALLVFQLAGQSINTMVLGGLVVALGVVIDDAVVGIENVERRLAQASEADVSIAQTIAEATAEVRAPVVYATFLLALTILPIIALGGIQGAFFSPLGLSFLVAILASLLVAVTLTPALLVISGHNSAPHTPVWLTKLKSAHARYIATIFEKPRWIVGVNLGVGLPALIAASLFGGTLLPSFREGHYVLAISGPAGASLDWSRQAGAKLAIAFSAIPQVESFEQQIGRAKAGEDTFPTWESEFHMELKHGLSAHEQGQAEEAIQEALSSIQGAESEVNTFLGDRIGESLSGETAAVAINLSGENLDVLDETAGKIAEVLGGVKGAEDVQVQISEPAPALQVQFSAADMTAQDVSANAAFDAIALGGRGLILGQATEGSRVADVVMTIPATSDDPTAIGNTQVVTNHGASIPLSTIATISLVPSRTAISREDGVRRQIVTANPKGDITGFVRRAKAAIAQQVELPDGVVLSYGGTADGQAAATAQLALNVAIASIAIIGLLYLAFGGLRPLALILSGVPFALAGGVVGVALTGGILSLGALVGFVTLFGVAARNAILLISHAQHLVDVERQPWTRETVMQAARERLTPILMTALVTVLGLLPLVLQAGQTGREIQGPMAIVILGGLITSTLMSLFLLPVLIWHYLRPAMNEQTGAYAL
jgi:CzcA family heavy metal efflux pump